MPHYAALPRFHLSRLPTSTKWLVTLYLLSVLLALAVAVRYYAHKTAFNRAAVTRYYQGDPLHEGGTESGGALVIHEEKSDLELVQFVHPHLFSVPIVLFILCHFFAIGSAGERTKVLVYTVAFLAAGVLFASPWLVRAHGGFAGPLLASAALLIAAVVYIIARCLWDLWLARPPIAGDPL